MPSGVAAEIARLREEIRRHDHKYYVEARPEISDLEYDKLMERLKALEAKHPELVTPDSPTQRVGEQPVEGLPQVEHRVPMLSIDNTYSIDDLKKFGERTEKLLRGEKIGWVVELKVDGVAVALLYENGLFVRGATRGNGRVGDEVTHNLRTVRDVPLRLRDGDVPPLLELRGEVYITNSDLVAINQEQTVRGESPFANPRNAAAGSIRLLDPRLAARRRLRFFCHSVGAVEGLNARSHMEFLDAMQRYGIHITPHVKCFDSFAPVVEHCQQVVEQLHELDFEIDGLVIKVDRFDQRERLGATSKAPRWVIAYKFEKYEAATRVSAIRVQVGKTGAITPVADLEPVEIAGTVVSRVSLHNADEIERKDIRVGDVVVVEKAGKIIPHVVRVEKHERKGPLKKFAFPEKCPECAAKLVKDEGGVYIRCPNPECPAQLKERLRYYASRNAMDIEGLGKELIKKLVDDQLVKKYGDLYRLTVDVLTGIVWKEEWGSKKAKEVLEAIEMSKGRGLARLLYGLAIPDANGKALVALAEKFRSMDAILQASVEELAKVHAVGLLPAASIHAYLERIRPTLDRLKAAGVSMEYPDSDKHIEWLKRKKEVVLGVKGKAGAGLLNKIAHYAKRNSDKKNTKDAGAMNIGHPTFVNQLVDEGLVKDYADLYTLDVSQLEKLERTRRMSRKEAGTLLEQIKASKQRDLARLLNALAIRHVGARVARVLAERFSSMDRLMAATLEQLSEVNDIGPIIAQSVYDYLHSEHGAATIRDLKGAGLNMKSSSAPARASRPLEGKTIVVTGTLEHYTRDQVNELIEQHGGRAGSSVSKKTDYVLAGKEAGSKLDKAKQLGVPVLSEKEFLEVIGENS